MARCCVEWFPETNGFYMDDVISKHIESMAKNVVKDWDFTIIIAGFGEVRVGKSVLAMQIGIYWTYLIHKLHGVKITKAGGTLPIFTLEDNFVFTGDELIKKGNALGEHYKYSCLIFDEAGADLESRKTMKGTTQAVLDYFRECGQHNLLNILVIPEYFDLPKTIAVSRSIFLLNVTYQADDNQMMNRGVYYFYSKKNKKKLYLWGKKDCDYDAYHPDLRASRFDDFYPIDKEEYKKLKKVALQGREKKEKDGTESSRIKRMTKQRNLCLYLIRFKLGLTIREIEEAFNKNGIEIDSSTINGAIKEFTKTIPEDEPNVES